MSQMHNPYAEERDHTVFEIGHMVSWLIAILFFLILAIPPLFEHVFKISKGEWKETPTGELLSWNPGGEKTLLEHIRWVEGDLDSASYSTEIRKTTQAWLSRQFGEGNSKTFIGFEGWLYYRPDLKALTGHGPLKKEPVSVMKAPELAKLPESREVILNFARQLEERGVKLLLVPVPLKTMIYPEFVSPDIKKAWITHPDAPAYYELLRSKGVDVLDLTAELAEVRNKRQYVYIREPDRRDREAVKEAQEAEKKLQEAFLMQDTHWTPDGMRTVAEFTADYIKKHYPEAVAAKSPELIRAENGIYRNSLGDLVKLLDPKNPDKLFPEEEVFLSVIGEGTQSKDSPVVLLGDSFVNIFNDPSIGFGDPSDLESNKPVRAGFAQHLSLLLQKPLDIIAQNGKGATGVRQEFAKRYDDEIRSKKLVVWVIAARDILLSRTAAHQANINWNYVKFNPNQNPAKGQQPVAQTPTTTAAQKIVIEATMSEKSPNQDPNGTPYREALHTAVYDVEKVVEGSLEASQVIGVQWTFRNKEMQPTSKFVVGKRYKLTLVPWESRSDMHLLNLEDTTLVFDAARWFVESAEEIP